MQSEEARLRYLFQRYFNKTASREERSELTTLISNDSHKALFLQLMTEAWDSYQGGEELLAADASDAMLKQILANEPQAPVRRLLWPRIAAAAAVLIIITGTAWFILRNANKTAPRVVQEVAHDAAPGSFKAQLTLADGSHITLDSAGLGQLAKQGNTAVINNDSGLLYKPAAGEHPVIYNTISTSRGETYSFSLADGSKVWLNSASTVRFPVAFTGKERRIAITGEVYVKVAKDRAHPFFVTAGGMDVKALGTEFNVNAYSDEAGISTTLVEGSVLVSKQTASQILQPGEQTRLQTNGNLSTPREVNTEEVVSWKEGYFHFESADLPTILRQFARWYDIDVVYEGPVTKRKFFTIVKRNSTLKNVLELLQDNNIVYKIEGKKLIVSQ